MAYVIYFESKVVSNNTGYFSHHRKEGFTSVFNIKAAHEFKTLDAAKVNLKRLEAKEGDYYHFEIINSLGGKMTAKERDAILEYVAQEIISPLADDPRPASEVWEELTGDTFSKLCKFVSDMVVEK